MQTGNLCANKIVPDHNAHREQSDQKLFAFVVNMYLVYLSFNENELQKH